MTGNRLNQRLLCRRSLRDTSGKASDRRVRARRVQNEPGTSCYAGKNDEDLQRVTEASLKSPLWPNLDILNNKINDSNRLKVIEKN